VWAVAIATRRSEEFQMVLLLFVLGAVYCAEWINGLARSHWEEFAGQNYFDKRGVFVSIMFSAPLLGVAMFVLLNALRSASRLLIQVKRRELRAKARQKKE
jgi:TRAP-type uncharacterized transport system fused permease subunit